ncbi:hypothetical protein GMB70_09305 [Turicibacter sanguinis]|nr:hypothetical protein [Turicibacter sanguinis]
MKKIKKSIVLLYIFGVLFSLNISVHASKHEYTTNDIINFLNKQPRVMEDLNEDLIITEEDRDLKEIVAGALEKQGKMQQDSLINTKSIPLQVSVTKISEVTNTELLDISMDENELILEYALNGKRYALRYLKDGSIIKEITTYYGEDEFILYHNFNNSTTTITDSSSLPTIVDEIPEEEALKLSEKNEESCDLQSRSSVKLIKPHDAKKQQYSASYKTSKSYTFPSLKANGYSATQTIKLYESMKYFNEVKATSKLVAAKSNISVAANFWNISLSTAKDYYKAAGVFFDTAGYIQEATKPVAESEYTFSGGIEATVYDPTKEKANVEILNQWGSGLYTLTWDRGYNGFTNAKWGISSNPWPFTTSYSTHLSDAFTNYDAHISKYGYWRNGKGQLGY